MLTIRHAVPMPCTNPLTPARPPATVKSQNPAPRRSSKALIPTLSVDRSWFMKHNPGKILLLALAMGALLSWFAPARAGILYSQPYDGFSAGVPSQVFTDTSPPYNAWSTKAFDDFTVTGTGWLVQGATIYGQDQGDSTQNVSVNLQFQSTT